MKRRTLGAGSEGASTTYHSFLLEAVSTASNTFKCLENIEGIVQDPLLLSYCFAREIDEIEDNRAFRKNEKIDLMNKLRSMLYGDRQSAIDLERRFCEVRPTEKKFEFLLHNTVRLYEAHESMPEEVKKLNRTYLGEMTIGLRSEGIRNYYNFEGYHQYCENTTGLIGNLIAKTFRYGGILNDKDIKKVMPYPESTEIGKNPAYDWGISIQVFNDIRDVIDDHKVGMHKWPKILFDKKNINYQDLIDVKETKKIFDDLEMEIDSLIEEDYLLKTEKNNELNRLQMKIEGVEGVHDEMCQDASALYLKGLDFIDAIPIDKSRAKEVFGGITAVVVATGRVVSASEFLYDESKRNITKYEFCEIFRICNKLALEKRDFREFLTHVLEKPAENYKI